MFCARQLRCLHDLSVLPLTVQSDETLLVSWCFEPSQPRRITSGLMKRCNVHDENEENDYAPFFYELEALTLETNLIKTYML